MKKKKKRKKSFAPYEHGFFLKIIDFWRIKQIILDNFPFFKIKTRILGRFSKSEWTIYFGTSCLGMKHLKLKNWRSNNILPPVSNICIELKIFLHLIKCKFRICILHRRIILQLYNQYFSSFSDPNVFSISWTLFDFLRSVLLQLSRI